MQPTTNRYLGEPFIPVVAVAVDMFPHTPHCELVMMLERPSDPSHTIADLLETHKPFGYVTKAQQAEKEKQAEARALERAARIKASAEAAAAGAATAATAAAAATDAVAAAAPSTADAALQSDTMGDKTTS